MMRKYRFYHFCYWRLCPSIVRFNVLLDNCLDHVICRFWHHFIVISRVQVRFRFKVSSPPVCWLPNKLWSAAALSSMEFRTAYMPEPGDWSWSENADDISGECLMRADLISCWLQRPWDAALVLPLVSAFCEQVVMFKSRQSWRIQMMPCSCITLPQSHKVNSVLCSCLY